MTRSLRPALFAAALLACAPALAGERHADKAEREPTPADMEKMQKRVRLMRLVELSERLELDDKTALKINEALGQFDEKKKQVFLQMRDLREVLRTAAAGDAEAAREVDKTVEKMVELRKKVMDIDQDAYRAIAKDLTPKQKAKLALFYGEFQHKLMRMARDGRDGPKDDGPPPGP